MTEREEEEDGGVDTRWSGNDTGCLAGRGHSVRSGVR